jgi:hypothetical protein
MKLGPVSLLDCIVFVIFLAPQLILQAGLFRTVSVALKALPFLCNAPLPTARRPVSPAYLPNRSDSAAQ